MVVQQSRMAYSGAMPRKPTEFEKVLERSPKGLGEDHGFRARGSYEKVNVLHRQAVVEVSAASEVDSIAKQPLGSS